MVVLSGIAIGNARISARVSSFSVPKTIVSVEGRVLRLEYRSGKSPVRLYIAPTKIGAKSENLPDLIRVITRTKVDAHARAGTNVTFAAKLNKPKGPIVPGGYDFARAAFFKGIGAEAIAVTPIRVFEETKEMPPGLIVQAREYIESTLLSNLDGQKAAVAVALTVGFRNHLTIETKEALRRAGLSHLLAISGLHMGLVTMASFYVFEMLFAAIPAFALRVMPRKAAVLPTFAIALAYLLLSGASTSTVRAFLMVAVAMLAILADRRVVSLRSIAIAAGLILLFWPEMVLSVGFQMSFAATAGLVAFYERVSAYMRNRNLTRPKSRLLKVLLFVLGTGLTSVIAQIAIAPFALYHFQTLSVVGVISNMLVLPIMTLVVMPLLLATLVFMPFGAAELLAAPLAYCLGFILDIAQTTAHFPFAIIQTAVMSDAGFIVAVLCFLLFLVMNDWRWAVGAFSVMILAFIFGKAEPAEVLVSSKGTIIAQFPSGGEQPGGEVMHISGGRHTSYRARSWQLYWNVDMHLKSKKLIKKCDRMACRFHILGRGAITTIRALEAVKPACASGDIVILPRRYSRYCKGSQLILTLEDLENKGPLGLWFGDGGTIEKKWSR
ncbi:MAG: ComEC/Rec2 family competence protein [Kordiimonadaceae bacterium]|nr:ComEC/Rec2 family competence protein [Kordiimonadaceae bacterium]